MDNKTLNLIIWVLTILCRLFGMIHRPEWDRCAEVLEGGEERWVQISQGKKSDQLVTLLLKEIMGDGEGYEYFEPKVSG